jgi:hypothetical protein
MPPGFGINTRGTSQLLFRDGLDSNMLDNYQMYDPIWNKIMKAGTTNQVEIQRARISGPSRMYQSWEGEPPVLARLSVSNKFTAVDRTFQLGYGLTLEAQEDDKYGKIDQGPKYLGHAARMTEEYLVGAFVDDLAAGTAGYLGMDNLPALSASHPLMGSPLLQSNLVTNPVSLSIAGISAMYQLYADMKDENGDPIKVMPDTLIIPNRVGYIQDAVRMFGQEKELNTANNNDNPLKAIVGYKPMKIVINPFMTSTSAYFMVDSSRNDAWFLTRKGLTMTDWVDKPTGTKFVKARMRVLSYIYDWRAWVGAIPT